MEDKKNIIEKIKDSVDFFIGEDPGGGGGTWIDPSIKSEDITATTPDIDKRTCAQRGKSSKQRAKKRSRRRRK